MKKVLFLFVTLCLMTMDASASGIKTDYRNALIFAYSQANSVYEDDNIKLEFYDEQLWATNKTKKTIFIDLAQCFAFHNGSSTPLFDSSEKKQGDKKASKKGVSSKDDVYITIAPNIGTKQNETYICNMSMHIYGTYTTSESPSGDFTDYDKRLLEIVDELQEESKTQDVKGKNYVGSVSRHLTEDESINNIGASIAYAFNKNAEEWTNVALSTWVSDVIFAPYYVEMPTDLKKKDKRGFGVKETAPAVIHVRANSPFEFDEDKSPIIVCDWEGNYKKGTFTLGSTWISKKKGPSVLAVIGAVFTYGATLSGSLKETSYKKIIHFDGITTNWGKLSYVSDIMKTKQDGEDDSNE
ncbi:MAG: hypothetical protein IKZ62_05955 [Prevotella sp.]|nr:hypothetical protein [Prevotella sp.]